MNGIHSFCTIRAHSRHDDAQDKISEDFCHRVHHHVDRRLVKSVFGLRVEAENGVGVARVARPSDGFRRARCRRRQAEGDPDGMASRTVTEQSVLSRWAKGAVKPRGMCCTITMGTERSRGKSGKISCSAFGSASRDSDGDDCRSREGTSRGSIREAGLRRFSSQGEGRVRRAWIAQQRESL